MSAIEAENAPRTRLNWRTLFALSACGVSAGALVAGWAFRAPIVSALIEYNLSETGIDNDFVLERVDFGGLVLRDVRLGGEDLNARRIELRFAWRPLPTIEAISADALLVRARVSGEGFSFGALDAWLETERPRPPGRLPSMAISVPDGRFEIATPVGPLTGDLRAQGRIGADFAASAVLTPVARADAEGAIENAAGAFRLRSNTQGLNGEWSLRAERIALAGVTLAAPRTAGGIEAAANDMARLRVTATWGAGRVLAQGIGAETVSGRADFRRLGENAAWRGQARMEAALQDGQSGALWRASRATLEGRLASARDGGVEVRGRASVDRLSVSEEGRNALRRAWPALSGLPLSPLSDALREASGAALENANVAAPFVVRFAQSGPVLAIEAPIAVRGANGSALTLRPVDGARPILDVDLSARALSGAFFADLSGPGFPNTALRVERLTQRADGTLQAEGALSIADWRTPDAHLSGRWLTLDFEQRGPDYRLNLSGPITLSGPLGAGRVTELATQLSMTLRWGRGFSVAPTQGGCADARFAGLALPGLAFGQGALRLCALDGAFFGLDQNGRARGGFSTSPLTLAGHVEGAPSQTAQLTTPGLSARFSGGDDSLVMDAVAPSLALSVNLSPAQRANFTAERATASLIAGGGSWHAMGEVSGAALDDASLPANITRGFMRWRAEPHGEEAIIRFADGRALLTDRPPPNAPDDRLPAFNPVEATNISGVLEDGRLRAEGGLQLVSGARQLARFTARHEIASNEGEARILSENLLFSPQLQPFEITALARGVAENVRGPLDGEVNARWRGAEMSATARVHVENVSLSSATLPIIENVSGEIVFDDLLQASTPPGQRLAIGLINPGVVVRDGQIAFQLRPGGRVSIESARWPFAGGELAIDPTEITLGAETTRFILTLTDVDAAALLAQLNVPDLVATGQLGGRFPLVLTPISARIENGELAAGPAGGTITYSGAAAREATGPARLAFQALTSFRYDNLTLSLNGDLDRELVTAISFRGRNTGEVDFASGTPIAGSVAGVPFIFNVRVTAPFRQLGQMAAGAFDPRAAMEQAGAAARDASRQAEPPASPPIDPTRR